MESSRTLQPQSSTLRRALFIVIVALAMVAATSCETTDAERNEVVQAINATRTARGLRPLATNVSLNIKADKWAQKLRSECRLSHSKLSDGAPKGWRKLGENVGYGGGIPTVHNAFLNSPSHKANIVDRDFTAVGAAAVWGTCNGRQRVFVVQVFMK